MQDPLLYRSIHRIPITIIKLKVSQVTGIPLSLMLLPNKTCTARKREYVAARQISMALSKIYSYKSLSYIGTAHGGRDHATALHAIRNINNMLETRDDLITNWFNKANQEIKKWDINNNAHYNIPTGKVKSNLIKKWIKDKVPLFVREHRLKTYGKYCSKCGQLMK